MEIQKDHYQVIVLNPAGCNALTIKQVVMRSEALVSIFFCSFCPQGIFLRQHCKIAAPLHPFKLKSFNINMLIVVHRRVQEGATGCNGGAMKGNFGALHPKLKPIQIRLLPQMVQWCNAKKGIKTIFLPGFLLVTWKKNTLFILNYFIVLIWGSCRPVKGSRYPRLSLCQPVLVMWLMRQTKGRNQRACFTAHNYKLCDKRLLPSPIINHLGRPVCKKTAIKFKFILFLEICSVLRYPPPRERNQFCPRMSPPLLHINCSIGQNPFLPPGLSLVSQEKGGLGG